MTVTKRVMIPSIPVTSFPISVALPKLLSATMMPHEMVINAKLNAAKKYSENKQLKLQS